MKLKIKNWLLGGKKPNYRQTLEKEGRIPYLEKKVVRLERMIRELQANMNRLAARLQKVEVKKKGTGKKCLNIK